MSPFLALPPPGCSILCRDSEAFHRALPSGMLDRVSSDPESSPGGVGTGSL